MAMIKGLPNVGGNASGATVVASLVSFSEGNEGGLDQLTINDMRAAVSHLGIGPALQTSDTGGASRPGGLVLPEDRAAGAAPPEQAGMNIWLILAAAAAGIGVLYYVTKRKR